MRRALAMLAAGLASFTCLALGPFAQAAGAADAGEEASFVNLINQERTSRGLGALAVRDEVVPVARTWTERMMSDGRLSHNQSLGAQMPADWTRIGENVGLGNSSASLHRAFMDSASHRDNLLGDFTQLGVGVSRDGQGRMWVTIDFLKSSRQVSAAAAGPSGGCRPNTNPVATPSSSGATGYYVLGSDGGIFGYGNAAHHGSVIDYGLPIDAVLMTLTPSHNGYWVAGRDGGIFSFGDAAFHGSVPGLRLPVRVTAIDLQPTPTGKGYWILGADGGIFSFGDARFFGSLPGVGVRNTAVRLVPTPSGAGYWILGADGGIFSFGDAGFQGSVPGLGVRATGISMARSAMGNGYWILGADGGIFSFGDARFYGSVPGIGLCESVTGVQLSRTVGGAGYYIVSDQGRVFAFGDAPFLGDPASLGVVTRDVAAVLR